MFYVQRSRFGKLTGWQAGKQFIAFVAFVEFRKEVIVQPEDFQFPLSGARILPFCYG